MTLFHIHFDASDKGLAQILPHIPKGTFMEISEIGDKIPAAPVEQTKAPAQAKRGAPRGSKVEHTILAALAKGPQDTPALKAALEKVGFKGSSFGAATSKLQRSGALTRDDSGRWTAVSEPELPLAAE